MLERPETVRQKTQVFVMFDSPSYVFRVYWGGGGGGAAGGGGRGGGAGGGRGGGGGGGGGVSIRSCLCSSAPTAHQSRDTLCTPHVRRTCTSAKGAGKRLSGLPPPPAPAC